MSNKTPNLNSYISHRSFAAGASRANGAGVRAQDHLKKALAEVDGLFAGPAYYDATEPSSLEVEIGLPDDLEKEINDLAIQASPEGETQPKHNNNPSETSSESRRRDWSCTRHSMEILREINELVRNLHTGTINSLREGYRDAQDLREAGVIAFCNTITGPTPNDLKRTSLNIWRSPGHVSFKLRGYYTFALNLRELF